MDSTIVRMLNYPKRKKFTFEVDVKLELTSVPIVTGMLFCKVRLIDGGLLTLTTREEVTNHRVNWEDHLKFNCKTFQNPNTEVLDPCCLRVSVRKETKGGRSCEKLGFVDINLAEYAGAGKQRRSYLLKSYSDNKRKPDNSILKVAIVLRVVSGGPVFRAPPVSQQASYLNDTDHDEGIQEDLGRPTSVLSGGSDSRPSSQRVSGLSGIDSASFLALRNFGGSVTSVRSSELRRNSSAANDIGMRKTSSEQDSSDTRSCGDLTDTLTPQSSIESTSTTPPQGHQPCHSPQGPSLQGRHQHHKRNASTLSGCSSAYSTMSDTERLFYMEAHRMSTSELMSSRSRLHSSEYGRAHADLVIQKLMEEQNLTDGSREEGDQRLRLYVDKHHGVVTVTGDDLTGTNHGRQLYEVNTEQSSS